MASRNHFKKAEIKVIRDFIANIDPDIEVFRGHCYEVDIAEEQIYLGNKRYDRVSALFMNYWKNEFADFRPNWCVLSILHELGHIMTSTDELEDARFHLDNMYSFMYRENIINEQEYFNAYFNIPAEREATLWGIEFYRLNKELCDTLAEQIGV